MNTFFSGKNYIITGGASGIGLATAKRLKNAGANVLLWDINEHALALAGAELGVSTTQVDITRSEQVNAATAQAIAMFQTIDGVIHSAGILRTGLFEQVALADHLKMVNVNLTGTFIVLHHLLPYLRQSRGNLVLLASVSAFYGPPEFGSYAATKAAILSIAQSLRVELHDTGIQISVVTPNFVDTPLLDARNRQSKMVNSGTFMLKMDSPDRIALSILNDIRARRFMIYTGWRSYLIYALSRYLAFIAAPIMKRTWLNAQARVQ